MWCACKWCMISHARVCEPRYGYYAMRCIHFVWMIRTCECFIQSSSLDGMSRMWEWDTMIYSTTHSLKSNIQTVHCINSWHVPIHVLKSSDKDQVIQQLVSSVGRNATRGTRTVVWPCSDDVARLRALRPIMLYIVYFYGSDGDSVASVVYLTKRIVASTAVLLNRIAEDRFTRTFY